MAVLSFRLAFPRMFPKQQEYGLAVGLYYVIVISLFPLTLRFSNREEKTLAYRKGGGEFRGVKTMPDPSELLMVNCITTAEELLGFTTSLLRVKY